MLDLLTNYSQLILLIVILEGLLSVDNVAVLATITSKLPDAKQRANAVKYGILGAFVFRGLSLLLASWLISNPSISMFAKILGGIYLLYLGYEGLTPEADSIEEGNTSWLEKRLTWLNLFWRTVIIVEIMDLVFSLDNILAAIGMVENVAGTYQTWFGTYPKSLIIVWIAVFLGIITMRFVTVLFLWLLNKYPDIKQYAMIVIMLLGFKLIVSGICTINYLKDTTFAHIMEDHRTDFGFSFIMLGLFLVPVIKKTFLNLVQRTK